jgi:hypothetical protein
LAQIFFQIFIYSIAEFILRASEIPGAHTKFIESADEAD